LDALMPIAVSKALQKEIYDLSSNEELNRVHISSARLDKHIKKIMHRHRAKKAMKQTSKIVAVFIMGLCLLSIPLLSVEASRIAIFNTLIEWKDKYTKIQFDHMPAVNERKSIYLPAYLPEGFCDSEKIYLSNTVLLTYKNKAGEEILIQQSSVGTGSSSVDNENTNFKEISVSGHKAYLFTAQTPDSLNTLIWECDGVVFKISSVYDSTELIQIGESMKKNK